MSLRHALLALLSAHPMTGYDVAKRFDGSVGFMWQAPHSQIYPELRRMEDAGLVKADADGKAAYDRNLPDLSRALAYTGGRSAVVGDGSTPNAASEANRFAQLLAGGALPVFAAVARGRRPA